MDRSAISANLMTNPTEVAIWERVIHPDGQLTPQTARAILRLKFPPQDEQRMQELAKKAQKGKLSPDEDVEIEDYERVGTMLSILKSKARRVLKHVPARRPLKS